MSRGQQVPSADEQLGEIQDARLVERGTLAASELDEQPPPGLLVRAREHQSRRAEGRLSSGERVTGGPDRRAEPVLPASRRKGIAEVRDASRSLERRGGPPAHQQVGQRGEHRLALGSFGASTSSASSTAGRARALLAANARATSPAPVTTS